MPHGVGQEVVAEGEALLLDFGCQVDGYRSDMTRTVFVGEPSSEARQRHALVVQAQAAALAVSRSGQRPPRSTRPPGPRSPRPGIPRRSVTRRPWHRPRSTSPPRRRPVRHCGPAWCSASSPASTFPARLESGSRTSSSSRMPGRFPDPRPARGGGPRRAAGGVISTGDIRKGVVLELEGQPVRVLDWSHIKMAAARPQVRLKIQNVRSGAITERTFQAGTRWPRARVEQQGPVPLLRWRCVPLHGRRDLRPVRDRRIEARR